jgi:hypothetical protein
MTSAPTATTLAASSDEIPGGKNTPMASRRQMTNAAGRFTDVWYRDAVSDPFGEIERIYASIGTPLVPEVRAAMEGWLEADARQSRPAHRYSVEQFGLTRSEIRAAFADYIEAFVEPHESG